ncbi:MAG: motility protein A [Lachnospiraceae bacterium]|nr:motility protein A [Lachnospiraceae bacterium]
MDLASIIGLVGCVVVVFFGIISGNQGFSALGNFYDLPSIFITIGGTFFCVMISYSLSDFFSSFKAFKNAIKTTKNDNVETIKNIIDLSNIARKEGLLALEEAANNLEDQFMKKGVLLIVDGTDPELVRAIMETELSCIESRHKSVVGFYENIASMGPAWGMIGTLIGLVNMLKELSDIASVGPNMSVALLTTLYGSLIANWIAIPISGKLKFNNNTEVMLKEVMIEGLLSIQAGENPRVIEEKLKSFLSPAQRNSIGNEDENGFGGE